MLGWLTRLFGKRAQVESAPAPAAPPPVDELATAGLPAGAAAVASGRDVADVSEPSPAAGATEPLAAMDAREVCPTCGRTSVFAGPPGHRYCMHCALRQELFDASAAAHQ